MWFYLLLRGIWHNPALLASLSAIVVAQVVKVPIYFVTKKKWDLSVMFTTGGMPSSHSAAVASLATVVGIRSGAESQPFALAVVLAVIVMYDAAGIRRQAGEQAIAINNLEARIGQFMKQPLNPHNLPTHDFYQKKLKEMLGHRPIEVIVGCILGIAIGSLFALR